MLQYPMRPFFPPFYGSKHRRESKKQKLPPPVSSHSSPAMAMLCCLLPCVTGEGRSEGHGRRDMTGERRTVLDLVMQLASSRQLGNG